MTHLNKANGGPAIYRAMGSGVRGSGASGVGGQQGQGRREPRLFLPIKNNIAPNTGGLAYRIESPSEDGLATVVWEADPETCSADDALAGDRDQNGGGRTDTRDDAADWLRALLADGPCPARSVGGPSPRRWALARHAKTSEGSDWRGISQTCFRRALGVDLALPRSSRLQVLTEDAHTPASERLGSTCWIRLGNTPKMLTSERVAIWTT